MAKDRGPWHDGRRAWQRLDGWHQDGRSPGHPDDGDAALGALADVGQLRHLLDQAELIAVRTARRHRRSWAEIATQLGVSRQSAWERWRELDDTPEQSVADVVIAGAATELASKLRRRATVVVPDVVGRSWDDARHALQQRGLVAVGPDPDGVPLSALGWPDGTVTDQSPESGAKVPPGSSVTLWIGRGGGSAGVREPRRPTPPPRAARAMRDEETNEAIG